VPSVCALGALSTSDYNPSHHDAIILLLSCEGRATVSKPINVAIHGAGAVSREHAKAYLDSPEARLVGISSRRRESAERLREELGIECKVYDSYGDLLADGEVEALSICTPNFEHASLAIAAAEAGKHILLEKPVAIRVEDLRPLRDAVRAAAVRSLVSFVLHWNPLVETMKSLVGEGALGEIFYGECDYWHGIGDNFPSRAWIVKKEFTGSAIDTGGCHAVDMMRYLVGDIVEVHAFATHRDDRFDFLTTLVSTVKFANGAVGKISACLEARAPYMFNIDLLGTEGTLRNNRLFSKKLLPGQTDFTTIPTILPDSGAVSHHPFGPEIDHFIECIQADQEPHPNIEDGIKTQEVCLAMGRSAETGQPVRLPLPELA